LLVAAIDRRAGARASAGCRLGGRRDRAPSRFFAAPHDGAEEEYADAEEPRDHHGDIFYDRVALRIKAVRRGRAQPLGVNTTDPRGPAVA